MSRPAAVLLALGCLLLGACGSGSGSGKSTSSAAPPAGSLEALWRSGTTQAGIVPGSTDYQPGVNRFSFLVVDKQGKVVTTPTAEVLVSTGLDASPFTRAVARSEPIGVPGGASAGIGSIYVAHVRLPKPGRYWLLVQPGAGAEGATALGNLVVPAKPDAPAVGAHAIASDTPTLASTHGNLAPLTTAAHPDRALYRISVAQALARRIPFVLTFATPKFCQSRTCGPVVDVVSAVAKKFAGTPIRFIHVEIYKQNDPAKGFNRWVTGPGSWNLPNEPFTFVVDRRGVIRAKLSGAFSVGELERTIRETLLVS
jgi:hypothetical protein